MKNKLNRFQKYLPLALLLPALCLLLLLPGFAAEGDPVIVEINETNFPDANFRAYVETLNTDGEAGLSEAEIAAVHTMDVSYKSISKLDGIAFFTGLNNLNCQDNSLTSLDLSACASLYNLNASYNQLTSLILNPNAPIQYIWAYENQLASITLPKTIRQLSVSDNPIAALDLSGCTELWQLAIENTQIRTLDLSDCAKLKQIYLNAGITSLDLSACPEFTNIFGSSCSVYSLILHPDAPISGNIASTVIYYPEISMQIDLSQYAVDLNKISNLQGCSLSGSILTPDPTFEGVASYSYALNNTAGATLTVSLEPHQHILAAGLSHYNDTEHWGTCTDANCAGIKVYVTAHSWLSLNNGTHKCLSCDIPAVACSGEPVAACSRPVCSTCNGSYGEIAHASTETEIVPNDDGTHTVIHPFCCGSSEEPVRCSGGTATCQSGPACDICGQIYSNSLNLNNHTSTETRYTPDYELAEHHIKVHSCCGSRTDAPAEPCSGGTATCTNSAKCDGCKNPYGERNSANHASTQTTLTRNGNGTHTVTNTCCEAETVVNCSSATPANCCQKQVCDVCHATFGEKNPENHVNSTPVYVPSYNGKHIHKYSCCDKIVEDDIPCTYPEGSELCSVCGGADLTEELAAAKLALKTALEQDMLALTSNLDVLLQVMQNSMYFTQFYQDYQTEVYDWMDAATTKEELAQLTQNAIAGLDIIERYWIKNSYYFYNTFGNQVDVLPNQIAKLANGLYELSVLRILDASTPEEQQKCIARAEAALNYLEAELDIFFELEKIANGSIDDFVDAFYHLDYAIDLLTASDEMYPIGVEVTSSFLAVNRAMLEDINDLMRIYHEIGMNGNIVPLPVSPTMLIRQPLAMAAQVKDIWMDAFAPGESNALLLTALLNDMDMQNRISILEFRTVGGRLTAKDQIDLQNRWMPMINILYTFLYSPFEATEEALDKASEMLNTSFALIDLMFDRFEEINSRTDLTEEQKAALKAELLAKADPIILSLIVLANDGPTVAPDEQLTQEQLYFRICQEFAEIADLCAAGLHTYSAEWSVTEQKHFLTCTACQAKAEEADHTWGDNHICDVCGTTRAIYVQSTVVDENGDLIITLSNGETLNAGHVVGEKGDTGAQGIQGIQGVQGVQGETGAKGDKGDKGENGKSAYELAVANGYTGTLDEWLKSLIGATGATGENGANGKSAYELAVANGYAGTLDEWLKSLIGATGATGENGANGKSAYELAVANGYAGTIDEWLKSLIGATGATGENGANGKSAYELAVANGYTGTLDEWLKALIGATGAQGIQGIQGVKGEKGDTGATGAQGIQGVQGVKGDKGDTGATGAQGIQGVQGEKGDKGDKGDTGAQGPQGEKGEKGDKGDVGETGGCSGSIGGASIAGILLILTVGICFLRKKENAA